MMKNILKLSVALFLVLFCVHASYAGYAEARQPILWSMRSLGMGGAGIVVCNNEDALIFNPASLVYVPSVKFTVNALNAGINHSIISQVQESVPALQEIMKMDFENMSEDAKDWLMSPHSLGFEPGLNLTFVSPWGLNFGAYLNADLNAELGVGVWSPTLGVDAMVDGIVTDGLACKIYLPIEDLNPIDFGISARLIGRGKVDIFESFLSFMMQMMGDESFMNNYLSELTDGALSWGLGINTGLTYMWDNETMGLGLTFNNMGIGGGTKLGAIPIGNLGGGKTSMIPMTMNLGWGWYYYNWVFACDITDILTGGDIFKKIHLGAEYPLTNFLILRAGFNSGWPTVGCRLVAGLKLLRLYAEYAYSGSEAGYYAGQWADYYHRLNVALQF